MKKLTLFLITAVLFINILSAQRRTQTIKWFSLSAKAGIGNSYFLNTDHLSDDNVELNFFSLSSSFGGRFTFTYGDNIGIGSDLLFSTYNQKYNIKNDVVNDVVIYDKDIKIKTVDIIPFFRYTGYNTAYIEIGGKFSQLNFVSETNIVSETNSGQANFNPTDNIINNYEPKFTSAVLGFGLALYKTDRIDINLGARIAYSFTDLTITGYDILNDGFYPDTGNTATTNPISVQAIFEVNYYFAFWGDAKCGRGRLMLFQ